MKECGGANHKSEDPKKVSEKGGGVRKERKEGRKRREGGRERRKGKEWREGEGGRKRKEGWK